MIYFVTTSPYLLNFNFITNATKKGLLLPGPGVSLDKTEASYLKTTSFSKSLPLKVYAGLSLINDREDFFCDNLEVDTLFIDGRIEC